MFDDAEVGEFEEVDERRNRSLVRDLVAQLRVDSEIAECACSRPAMRHCLFKAVCHTCA